MDYLHTTAQGVQPPLAPYYLRPKKETTVTEHNHTTIVEGCFRCSLGMDEEVGMTNVTPREHKAFMLGYERGQESGHDDAVDLHERLEKAVKELQTLAGKSLGDPKEASRLRGKVEGVKLALSYMRETWRDI